MSKLNDLLNFRLKSKDSKMTSLAERSQSGELSSFSGIFKITPLNQYEKEDLLTILQAYQNENDINEDFKELSMITSEIKAITNQAVILHGERITKAKILLKNYKEGAFSAWLLNTYGNRQTPYNFLQYYEFYLSMPQGLRSKIDSIPRQAIYTLASRGGDIQTKEKIIESYNGQTKEEMLSLIREHFPLDISDLRQPNSTSQVFLLLKRVHKIFQKRSFKPTALEIIEIKRTLSELIMKLERQQ